MDRFCRLVCCSRPRLRLLLTRCEECHSCCHANAIPHARTLCTCLCNSELRNIEKHTNQYQHHTISDRQTARICHSLKKHGLVTFMVLVGCSGLPVSVQYLRLTRNAYHTNMLRCFQAFTNHSAKLLLGHCPCTFYKTSSRQNFSRINQNRPRAFKLFVSES